MSTSQVHVAGVGIAFSSRQDLANGAIEAGARALLDTGITYAKVQLSVACSLESAQARIPQECFRAFGRQKAPTCSMDSFSALHILAQCVRTGQTDCTMLVGLDQGAADRNVDTAKVLNQTHLRVANGHVCAKRINATQIATIAIILVSDRFLLSHAFLKDSAVHVKACTLAAAAKGIGSLVDTALRQAGLGPGEIQLVEAQGSITTADKNVLLRGVNIEQTPRQLATVKDFSTTGLASLCGIVWRLRGWIPEQNTRVQNCLQHTSSNEGQAVTVVLGRSDGQAAPKHEEIQHLRDGRERLGYNPAKEATQEIGWRMEGVMSREGDRMPIAGAGELQLTRRGGDRAALARL